MRIEPLVYKAARTDQSGSGFHRRASTKREQLVELALVRQSGARDERQRCYRHAVAYGARVSAEGRQARQRQASRYWREAIRPSKRNGCYANSKLRTELRWIHPVVHFDPK